MKPSLLLILLVAIATSRAHAIELTKDQWHTLFSKKVEYVVRSHYLLLSKNFTDAALIAAQNARVDAINAAATLSRIERMSEALTEKSAVRLETLREVAMLRSQARYLEDSNAFTRSQWERLKSIRKQTCSAQAIGAFAQDFSASAVLSTRQVLTQLKEQLDEFIKNGGNGSTISISYRLPFGEGTQQVQMNHQTVSGELNIETMTQIGSGVGAAVGSFVGPVGTLVGGAIGWLVGGLVGEIFFETPLGRLTRIVEEQSDNINDAASEIATAGVIADAAKSCGSFVGSPNLEAVYREGDASIGESSVQVRDAVSRFDRIYEERADRYREQLETLAEETIPIVKESIGIRFEKFFADVSTLSKDSKNYMRERIVPPLTKVLKQADTQDSAEAQDVLWTALIEGDARYTDPFASQEAQELIYWTPAASALRKRLQSDGEER